VTYNTNYKGEVITASGLVFLPITEDKLQIVSFFHGTIGSDAEAPSNLPLGDVQNILSATLSSLGFIVAVPDFIGFGSSKNIMHPYYVEDLNASDAKDMLRAAVELALSKRLNVKKDLFLSGYSQGGYYTMATHKAIETNGFDDFNLVASFPSSGGYDVKNFQEYFFDLETYHQPFFMAYVSKSYKETYDFGIPMSDLFNIPFADRIDNELFDGNSNGSTINQALNDTLSVLLNAEFVSGIDNDSKYMEVKDALESNSLTDWSPSIQMFMYHGDSDITVPYQNSIVTLGKINSSGKITFETLPGATHGGGVTPYLNRFVPKLLELSGK
jgi:pimeloyl-ACP methyl ester carboxylesterase